MNSSHSEIPYGVRWGFFDKDNYFIICYQYKNDNILDKRDVLIIMDDFNMLTQDKKKKFVFSFYKSNINFNETNICEKETFFWIDIPIIQFYNFLKS